MWIFCSIFLLLINLAICREKVKQTFSVAISYNKDYNSVLARCQKHPKVCQIYVDFNPFIKYHDATNDHFIYYTLHDEIEDEDMSLNETGIIPTDEYLKGTFFENTQVGVSSEDVKFFKEQMEIHPKKKEFEVPYENIFGSFFVKWDEHEKTMNKLQKDVSTVIEINSEMKEMIEKSNKDLENKNTNQKIRIGVLETKNSEQQNRNDDLETKNSEQRNRNDDLETKNSEQQNRIEDLEKENAEQQNRIEDLEKKNALLINEKEELEKKIKDLESMCEEKSVEKQIHYTFKSDKQNITIFN